MYSQLAIRDSANDIAKSARKLAHKASHDAYNVAHRVAKQFRRVYPGIASNVHEGLHNVHTGSDMALRKAKSFATSTRYGVKGVTMQVGRDLRFMESCLIHVGLGYVVVKLYNAYNNKESAPASVRIKTHINEKPVESVLIALGTGYLLGKLLR